MIPRQEKGPSIDEPLTDGHMARLERFELPTARFVAEYSIQLSYRRFLLVSTDFRLRLRCELYTFSHPKITIGSNILGGEGGIRTLDEAINPILP